MLMIWFTLPAPHAISMKDILDLLTHFHLGTITEKACRGTAVNDVIREDAGKHGYALQGVNIGEERCSANKDLGIFLATINSRDIGFNGVSSNVLIVASYIQGWIWQFKMLAENSVVRKMGILSHDIKGFLNNVRGSQANKGHRHHNPMGLEPPYVVHGEKRTCHQQHYQSPRGFESLHGQTGAS